jgi:ATP-binding cassette, subfamily C (CFTR/MRP), member 1
VIDLQLPQSFLNTVFALCVAVCSVIVLAISSPYTLVSLAVSVVLLWYIGSRYVATSSQLRTLQIAAAAPMIEFLRAGFDGRCTIRAFGFQHKASLTLLNRLHQAQKSAYLFQSLQTWLTLMLNLIATGVAVTLAALLVGLKSKTNVGWAGIALVNTIVLSQELKLLIHWITTFEVAMGAIQRIREFITLTPSEDDGRPDGVEPKDDWPDAGEIKFENVACCYG